MSQSDAGVGERPGFSKETVAENGQKTDGKGRVTETNANLEEVPFRAPSEDSTVILQIKAKYPTKGLLAQADKHTDGQIDRYTCIYKDYI